MQRRGFVLSILSAGVLGASGITPLIGALPQDERAPAPIKWSKIEVTPNPHNFYYLVFGMAECAGVVLTYSAGLENITPDLLLRVKEETFRAIRQEFIKRGVVPQ